MDNRMTVEEAKERAERRLKEKAEQLKKSVGLCLACATQCKKPLRNVSIIDDRPRCPYFSGKENADPSPNFSYSCENEKGVRI